MTTTTAPPPSLDSLSDEICTLAGQIASATGRFLALLAAFDAREGWSGPGMHSCAHWLSWRCGMDLRTAREHVRVARALVTLPRIAAELDAGRLSYSKVRALSRVASPERENDLVDLALDAPAAHVERLVRGLKACDDREELESMTEIELRERDAHRRRTQFRWDADTGDLVIWGRLAPQDGALLLAALTRAEHERTRTGADAAHPAGGPAGPPDLTAGPPKEVGPALVAMASMTCSAVDAPARATGAEVLVHHNADGAHLDGGPALPDAATDELECGSRTRDVLLHNGCVLFFGRSRRRPSDAQLLALHLRDGGCRAPGCGRTRFLHAHHVVPFSRGGATDLDNLILLCGECHRGLHLGGFAIAADRGQRFTFHRGGQVWEVAPATSGHALDLETTAGPDTLGGRWTGEPLDVGYATEVLLQAWRPRPAA